GIPHLERTTVYNAEGSSGDAPACLGDRVLELLPEVKKAIDGCWSVLGLPDGMRRLHMEFVVFMPPGVGGTGGGGRITMEMGVLFPFAAGTDDFPGPFTHELGHNLGFGHDPYMLLAPSGVDEPRFGTFGYRMLHAADFQRTLRYLEGDRGSEKDPWAPGIGVFDGLRLLYGPDVHHKMLTLRRAEEQTLVLHGLSSIERIATLYSLVLDKNVAWVFRAHGWPVFDARVDLGARASLYVKQHPLQLNYARLTGTAVGSWWVLGPVKTLALAAPPPATDGGESTGAGGRGGNGGSAGEGTNGGSSGGGNKDKGSGSDTTGVGPGAGPDAGAGPSANGAEAQAATWRRVVWPSAFIRLDEERSPESFAQSYLLFRRIKLPQEVEARLVCASDVQLEVRLNGNAVGFFDASPQYTQPVHDELMLNQKRGFHVKLYAGENFLEVAANQPPGSRGFLLEFLTVEGKALPLAFVDEGPEGEDQEKKVARLKTRNPVLNHSFELGETFATAWVHGPVEPWGGFDVAFDKAEKVAGDRSLRIRLKTAARGGVIQRIVLEPGKRYEMSALMRTENLDGEAFVSFFTGDVHVQFGKTPPLREPNSPWARYEMSWFPGESRVAYIACYVHGKSGTVWFDQIEMKEIP
ncbi:MAG: hypothetical protein L0Z55_10540, partial [Planctomycetes bacterium]|nr:hypothetical protein [Planctomycetota bacterium]